MEFGKHIFILLVGLSGVFPESLRAEYVAEETYLQERVIHFLQGLGNLALVQEESSHPEPPVSEARQVLPAESPRSEPRGYVAAFLGISSNEDRGAVALGALGGWNASRYFGVEWFGFHDVVKGPHIQLMNASRAGDESQYALFGNLRARYPIPWGDFILIPKAGVGYGVRGGFDLHFAGVTALAGIAVELRNLGTFDVEYLQGIGGRTRQMSLQTGGGTSQTEIVDHGAESFQRISVGLRLNATEQVGFGLRYLHSRMKDWNRSLTLLQVIHSF